MIKLEYWLAISEYCKFTIPEIEELMGIFGDLEKVWNADEDRLLELAGSNGLASQIAETRKRTSIDTQTQIVDLAEEKGVTIVPGISEEYPDWLHPITRPPKTLYIRGNVKALQKNAVAIVGTREPTMYARSKVKEIAYGLSKEGYTIVSGLAEGIDTESHIGALEARGMTVAVLPGGVLRVAPRTNQPLADRIVNEKGALVSEFGLETPAARFRFIERNRITSGLALATIVAEGSLKSGTRYTAEFARRQRRCLLALKPIDDGPQAELPRSLHSRGVEYVDCSRDVLDALERWKQKDEYQQMTLG